MAKKKTKSDKLVIPCGSWGDADAMVRRVGDYDREIARIEADATAEVEALKAAAATQAGAVKEKRDQLINSLKAFATSVRCQDFQGQSRELNHGVIGWRKSTSISITKGTLDKIKDLYSPLLRKQCITIKESVSKDALAKLDEDKLKSIGAKRRHKETFFVEPAEIDTADTST